MRNTDSPDHDYSEIDQFDKCELHAGQPLSSVCLDCEECICDECFRFIHSSHRRQELKDYNRTQLEVLEDNRRKLTEATAESKTEVARLETQIKRSHRKSVLAVKEATVTAEELWREIKRKKDELAQGIAQYTIACANQLRQQIEELHNRLKQFRLLTERIQNVTMSDNPSLFFKNIGGLKKHCTGALNLKSLYSLPVYIPEFKRNPNLLSDFAELQIGVVESNNNSDIESSDEYVYEIDEEWVCDVEPLAADSFNISDEEDAIETKHEDDASAGSSYCQHSGSEMNDKHIAHKYLCHDVSDCSDNSSAGSSYAQCSRPNLEHKHHTPEGASRVEPGCSDRSSVTLSAGDNSISKVRPEEEQVHRQTCVAIVPFIQYSFARLRTASTETGHLTRDRPIYPDVDTAIDDDHAGEEFYESLLQKHDTSHDMLCAIDKYDSLLGSTMSLDRIDDRAMLPQKFRLHFNKFKIIQTENTILSGKVLKRVFLPFTVTGFTTVSREKDTLLAFVTTDKEVVLVRKNGIEFARIRELTSPFDVGNNGNFPYSLYITDGGARPGEGSVRVYSCGGGYLDTFAGGLNAPRGIDLSADGRVFVCDQGDRCVYGFSPKGRKTLRLNIGGPGFLQYVTLLSGGRLAVTDNERENLIIYHIDGQKVELLRTKVNDSFCRGMSSEDVNHSALHIVHPEVNCLHVIRAGQHEVIDLGMDDGTYPLVPMIDERGNVSVF